MSAEGLEKIAARHEMQKTGRFRGGVIVPHRNRTRVLVSGRFCLRPAVGCDRMCSVE